MRGLQSFCPSFNSEMGAAGPLGVFLLQNPSNGLRGMATCWDWAFGFPSSPPLPHFFKMRCSQTTGQNSQSKSHGGALAHCQNRSSFDWSENSSHDFVLVPKDHGASTYLVQQITHGSWQHWLILGDVKVILSKSQRFWCTWMCSKPFRYYRQLLNKSPFLIALRDTLISAQAGAKCSCGQKISMKYKSSSQSSCARSCTMNRFLPSQAKCFNLLALEHWFTSEQNSTYRRRVSGLFAVAFTRSYLGLFLGSSVWKSGAAFECKTLLWLLCLYHAGTAGLSLAPVFSMAEQ